MQQENHIIYFHHCHLITLFCLYLLHWMLLSERIILDVSINILMTFHYMIESIILLLKSGNRRSFTLDFYLM